MITDTYRIVNGDYIECFNGDRGIVKTFDPTTCELIINSSDIELRIHIVNVCQINDINVDSQFDTLKYEK